MDELKNSSPLLIKYLRAYQENRQSRVFAPLAETYRKLGMYQEALKILKEGIRFHPSYILGYLVLAHCYFDQEKYDQAYNILRPIVSTNLENTGLQNLFAEICEKLFLIEEALETYKYLLFLNPKDMSISMKVKSLEEEILNEKENYLLTAPTKFSNKIESNTKEDDWTLIDFSTKKVITKESNFKEIKLAKITPASSKPADQDELLEIHEPIELNTNGPMMMTVTLADIYLKQNLISKAKEVVEKILEIQPNNQKAKEKLKEILLLNKSEKNADLMDYYDQKIGLKKNNIEEISDKFKKFLYLINQKSAQVT